MVLTQKQKNDRVQKITGNKAFPSKKQTLMPIILANIDNYPDDPKGINCPNKHKLLTVDVKEDGTTSITGVVLNGKEYDDEERTCYSGYTFSDEESAKGEWDHFQKGTLKEIDIERTKYVHEANGHWTEIKAKIDAKEIKEV